MKRATFRASCLLFAPAKGLTRPQLQRQQQQRQPSKRRNAPQQHRTAVTKQEASISNDPISSSSDKSFPIPAETLTIHSNSNRTAATASHQQTHTTTQPSHIMSSHVPTRTQHDNNPPTPPETRTTTTITKQTTTGSSGAVIAGSLDHYRAVLQSLLPYQRETLEAFLAELRAEREALESLHQSIDESVKAMESIRNDIRREIAKAEEDSVVHRDALLRDLRNMAMPPAPEEELRRGR